MQFEKWATIDLDKARTAQLDLGTLLFEGDTNPVKIGVKLTRGGAPVTAGSASGWAVLADGTTSTPFANGHEDNEAWVIVPQGALAVPGKIEIFLRVSDTVSGNTTAAVTVYAFGYVKRTVTNQQINPGTPIPSVAELNQAAADCIAATAAASNAVSYEAQTGKTADEKAAARANIDAVNIEMVEAITGAAVDKQTSQITGGTRGQWTVSDGSVSVVTASSGYNYAMPAFAVTPGKIIEVDFGGASGECVIFGTETETSGTYTYVSGVSTAGTGHFVEMLVVPDGATHILLTRYGTTYQTSVSQYVMKTDGTLSESNVAADAAAVGSSISTMRSEIDAGLAQTDAKVEKISDGGRNIAYFTNSSDRTLPNGATLTFSSPSRFTVSSPSDSQLANQIPMNGNSNYNANTFRKNLNAGTYYLDFDKGSISGADVYLQYRYSDLERVSVTSNTKAMITLTADAEIWVTISIGSFSGEVHVMLAAAECAYEDYGYLTATDQVARASIDAMSPKVESSKEVTDNITILRNNVSFTNTGFFPYAYYPRTFKSEFILDLPLHPGNPTGNSATSGMCGDGVRYLWVTVRSGETSPIALLKYDITTWEIVQQRTDIVLGHGQSMCYCRRTNEIYVLSNIYLDTVDYEDGGTRGKVTVLDADTLSVKRHFGTKTLLSALPSTCDYLLAGIAWSDTFGCLVGVTAPVSDTYTERGVLLFTESDGILTRDGVTAYRALSTAQGAWCDGVMVDNSYIVAMISYRPMYIRWDTLEQVGFNGTTAGKFCQDQVSAVGHDLEPESIVLHDGCVYVNVNVLDVAQSQVGAMKLYRCYPDTFKFATV